MLSVDAPSSSTSSWALITRTRKDASCGAAPNPTVIETRPEPVSSPTALLHHGRAITTLLPKAHPSFSGPIRNTATGGRCHRISLSACESLQTLGPSARDGHACCRAPRPFLDRFHAAVSRKPAGALHAALVDETAEKPEIPMPPPHGTQHPTYLGTIPGAHF